MKKKPLQPKFKGVKTICGTPYPKTWNISKITITGPCINFMKHGESIDITYAK